MSQPPTRLSVLTLLPLEIILAAITGEGGLLYFISKGLTDAILGGGGESDLRPGWKTDGKRSNPWTTKLGRTIGTVGYLLVTSQNLLDITFHNGSIIYSIYKLFISMFLS